MRCASIAAATLLAACGGADRDRAVPATMTAASAPLLHAQGFGTGSARSVRTLVFVLHGDAATATADGQYDVARAIAAALPDTRAFGLLRPGYRDAAGNVSPGLAGGMAGDSYTRDRIAQVAATIARTRADYPNARAVLVGHAGGAAIAADLAGLNPGLVDGVVLAGCPCMLPEWRRHMGRRGDAAYAQRVDSFDPLMTVGGVPVTTRVALLVGANDAVTPQRLSRGYAEALALRGIATDYRVLPGRGHDILADAEVVDAVRRMTQDAPVRQEVVAR